jgi:hypothetical protein
VSRRSTAPPGPYTVGGLADLSFADQGVALSRALNRAERATEEVQVGVYFEGRQVYRIEREASGVITVRPVQR